MSPDNCIVDEVKCAGKQSVDKSCGIHPCMHNEHNNEIIFKCKILVGQPWQITTVCGRILEWQKIGKLSHSPNFYPPIILLEIHNTLTFNDAKSFTNWDASLFYG